MSQRLLTKSRFKLALDCPNKLFYTKKKEYANKQLEDPFLEALAQGGFQVEELARLEYPEGILIEGNDWNYDLLAAQTAELLQQENVVIFEAAFKFENLFIRTDILVKRGNNIQLIEVKAKSFEPEDENLLVGKKGGLVSGWKPYLFDVAFQRYVIQQCHPEWKIKSYLMLADKSKESPVEGLNQLFRISKKADNRTGITRKINSLEEIGGRSVLGKVPVDEILDDIESGKHMCFESLDFLESIKVFSEYYVEDKYFNAPVSWNCKGCEFKATPEEEAEGMKSGYKECWSKQMGWKEEDFAKASTFDVWDFRRGSKLFEEGKIFLDGISEDDIGLNPAPGKISRTERQWIQIEKSVTGDTTPHILKEELRQEMSKWKFPLNFIDFETSATALPFNKGRRPYEQVAFQFSHHTVDEAGNVKHESEYINFEPGNFPNFEFVRELKKALSKNKGSIFRYAAHENSILNAIYYQLNDSDEPDKEELQEFIKTISQSTKNSAEKWCGDRNMIDLLDVVKDYYYDPYMGGSNSIKAVLPAVLNSSAHLQEKYSRPIAVIGLSSKNFDPRHVWLQIENDKVLSPYKMLPPLFADWDEEQLDATVSGMQDIADGGAALTAYGKLQYTDMPEEERLAIKQSLLKYCELDTLAMVMIWEYFRRQTC
ncbi:DUF2779 domain-containing protein [Antarcticibacterium flavum]|uniref:DUF2779 domain-containing protein n=1 Tax=Antarcticibacterium flavum TaxID=2058175 RepID=A0A5B7X367_9FLAO|nr:MULTISPECIES: DUF2779 domain-containing protein [Antarcticibacterium]MCM4161293.1 DUF2779 domain-containing protein [Antarcticibacterium sp. W02-3]QCY69078.1 DUF2779 domain-containing protein [Antarcticibacterium flavum]